MQRLADGGGIYTLGLQPGTVLRGSAIHDVHRCPFTDVQSPNNGIFFDEGSQGYLVEDNIIYNAPEGAIRLNQSSAERAGTLRIAQGKLRPAPTRLARMPTLQGHTLSMRTSQPAGRQPNHPAARRFPELPWRPRFGPSSPEGKSLDFGNLRRQAVTR